MTKKTADLIRQWLESRLTPEQTDWFNGQLKKIEQSNSDRELHITLGLIPRKLGRDDLTLSMQELTEAQAHIEGWNPDRWSVDIAARILVMCQLAEQRGEHFGETLTDLCRNADLAESIALYSGVSLYPNSDLVDLKALFIDSTLAPIYGLDKRANPELARILCDYANERWAAGREVTYELWRCVGPFANGDMVDDLERATKAENNREKSAALLALSACSDPRAAQILNDHPEISARIASGSLTWDAIEQEQTGNAS